MLRKIGTRKAVVLALIAILIAGAGTLFLKGQEKASAASGFVWRSDTVYYRSISPSTPPTSGP